MGEYLELLSLITGVNEITFPIGLKVNIFPNPTNEITNLVFNVSESDNIILSLYNINGQLIKIIDQGQKTKGTYSYQIDLSTFESGVYVLTLQTNKRKYTQKIIKS
jgi:flagellar hook assembly protein FlgD